MNFTACGFRLQTNATTATTAESTGMPCDVHTTLGLASLCEFSGLACIWFLIGLERCAKSSRSRLKDRRAGIGPVRLKKVSHIGSTKKTLSLRKWVNLFDFWNCTHGAVRLAGAGHSFLPGGILQQLCVHLITGQLHVPHNRSTNEAILHRPEMISFALIVRQRPKSIAFSGNSGEEPFAATVRVEVHFITYSICGYFSVSFTLMSVNLIFRYWSTEWSVPQMLLKISKKQCKH